MTAAKHKIEHVLNRVEYQARADGLRLFAIGYKSNQGPGTISWYFLWALNGGWANLLASQLISRGAYGVCEQPWWRAKHSDASFIKDQYYIVTDKVYAVSSTNPKPRF